MTTAAPPAPAAQGYRGTEKLLWGIVLAVLTFWLFAGTAGIVAPQILRDINSNQQYVDAASMNLAVSVTALFSGLFIVMMGGAGHAIGTPQADGRHAETLPSWPRAGRAKLV